MKATIMLAVFAGLLPLAAPAETFRCGKWIINEETTLTELTQKCGEPTSHDSRTEDVRQHNQYTSGWMKVGETTIERWIYDRGPRAQAMVVTVVDGRIKSIERLEK
jgi:Protein of unknown function (DUF2845)